MIAQITLNNRAKASVRLGCYEGEPITLISKKRKNCIVVIKDGRYNLDQMLSEAIII